MKNFIGTYECKIDDKGRLKLPSSLVKQMENFGSATYVVKRSVFQSCLEVYPMSGWEKLMEKIRLGRYIPIPFTTSIVNLSFREKRSLSTRRERLVH